ncbi:MAG: pectate lyase [Bryobacteraceae bacterium]|jgi:PelA/Pel-15E family pectate lyase
MRASLYIALLTMAFVSTLPAAVVGTSTPALSLTAERMAALPEAQRNAWKEYLERSARQMQADRGFLRAELQAAGLKEPTPAPHGSSARSVPLDQPREWYGGAEARRIAEIIVSFQTPAGGWSKNLDLSAHARRPGESFAPDNLSRYLGPDDFDTPRDAGWNYVGTLDNDATTTELRFLARVAAAAGARERAPFFSSFERGVAYLLAAQFPNGGWPQVWPLEGGYHDAITFNDGAVMHALELLQETAAGRNEFAGVPESLRRAAGLAVTRGVEAIVATQIVENGRRTVWAQQHDALTLAPTAGRNYEPAALSSSESSEVMLLLMALPKPDAAVVAAVDGAAAWFEKTAIPDASYERGPNGRRLAPHPGAPRLWARFYAMGTGRPVFGDRDKSIHDTVEEISTERQQGYSWYNSGPQEALRRYASWSAEHPAAPAPTSAQPRDELIGYLNGLAQAHLEERKRAVTEIRTRADAERRQGAVREKILRLLGGLPEHTGPVEVKQFGATSGEGFRVEKLAYESLPGFWVTADLYLPASGAGPFPAVVVGAGHGAAGKTENWSWGANFARNGIAALAYDPLGQGERLQYFDAARKASLIGNPTGEHGEANLPTLLIGDDLARYMVNDSMRAVDYLTTRKDIDGSRIGALGCSGGGTATAYFAALDPRVRAAATACYITSFEELLGSPTGVQDAEQTIPRFVEEGLDFGDWVELAAPRPYAIVSTAADMFPFEGARQTYEEARRLYAIFGAEDRLQWITGPGGHGNLGPIAPAILGFFTKNLKGSADAPVYAAVRPEHPEDMQCTPTGQVSTSLGGETVSSINRQRAGRLLAPQQVLGSKADLARMQARVRQDVRSLTGAAVEPGRAAAHVEMKASEAREGYRVETVSLASDAGMEVTGFLAVPDGAGLKPAVLLLDAQPQGADFERLARAGRIVLLIEPRPTPPGTESIKSPYLGSFNLLSLRAFLVGKTLVGLRVDDAIRAVDWLCARNDVDGAALTIYGVGALGMVALHAAALDGRIGRVAIENSLASYRQIIDQPVHRNVSEVVIPGVLRRYDTGELLEAVYPRPVTIVNPRDALGDAVSEADFRKGLAYVFESDRRLGLPDRIRLVWGHGREHLFQ